MDSIQEAIVKAVTKDGRTTYLIARAASMDPSHLVRVIDGKAGLSFRMLERLMVTLGLVLVPRERGPRVAPSQEAPKPTLVQAHEALRESLPAPVLPRPVPGLSQYQLNKRKSLGMD